MKKSFLLLFTSCGIFISGFSQSLKTASVQSNRIDGHPAWIMQGNIYEVNVRQYSKEGTLNVFAKQLDRLKAMGVLGRSPHPPKPPTHAPRTPRNPWSGRPRTRGTREGLREVATGQRRWSCHTAFGVNGPPLTDNQTPHAAELWRTSAKPRHRHGVLRRVARNLLTALVAVDLRAHGVALLGTG